IMGYNFDIYRMDSLDQSPTKLVLVTSSTPTSAGGISIKPNFDSLAGPETISQSFFFVSEKSPKLLPYQAKKPYHFSKRSHPLTIQPYYHIFITTTPTQRT
ncbi:MAG: hypothetical protein ABI855_18665, partial [Bacteroidota bacterium]